MLLRFHPSAGLQEEIDRDPTIGARKLFELRHELWAKPLVEKLEAKTPRLAFLWASAIFKNALPSRANSGIHADRLIWLETFDTLIETHDAGPRCLESNRIIWATAKSGALGATDRAIAHLYDALYMLMTNRKPGIVNVAIAGTLSDLAFDHNADEMDQSILEISIAEFKKISNSPEL